MLGKTNAASRAEGNQNTKVESAKLAFDEVLAHVFVVKNVVQFW